MTAATARRILAWLAAALLAAGCATQHPAFVKGQSLLAEGQWEQGIAQIEVAAREDDRNFEYRSALIDARIRATNELARQAGLLRDAGRFSEAEALYRRALRIQPEESRALAGLQQTAAERRRSALLKEADSALGKKDIRTAERNVRTILTEAPRHPRALALLKRIEAIKPQAGATPAALSAAMKKPITLQFRDANLRMIFDAISREAGINFVLDRDIPPAARATILVRNTPIEEAVESLIVTNALAKKVVSESHVLIYPNTPQKVREYQDLLIRNFYLQSAEAKQILTMLRTILKSQNIFIDEKRNLLVMRDTPEAIRLAERLIAAHDQVEPEVMLEVEILEVSRSKDSDLGIRFPDQIGFGVIADPTTVQSLRDLNASGIGVSGLDSAVTINLKKLFNNVNLLANPRIRVRNREKAKIHVGDRVPVISTSLSTTAALSSQQVTYLEVGIKLEVEPQVLDDEVVMKVGLEVSSLGAQEKVENAIAYRVGTRNASTTLTLKDGETQILAGLITDSEREAVNKLPGLGELPLVGRLFSSNASTTEKTEIMLSITPRILRRLERPSAELAEYPSGPETNLRSAVSPAPPAQTPVVKPAPGAVRGGVFPGRPPVTTTPTPAVPGAGPAPTAPAPATPTAPAPAAPAPAPAQPPTIIFQPPPGVGQ